MIGNGTTNHSFGFLPSIVICNWTSLNAIDAKKQEVAGLEAKADEKLQDFYTIKKRGNWQDPMFFGLSRFSEGINLLAWRTNLYFAVWKTII